MRRTLFCVMLLPSVIPASIVFAEGNGRNIEEVDTRIMELQQQIIELQKKHDEEIKVLKEQINRLADQAAKNKPPDELNKLRQLAQA